MLRTISMLFHIKILFFQQTVLPTASLPLENTHDNIDGWMSVMLDPDEEGSSKLVNRIERYDNTGCEVFKRGVQN